MPKSSTPALLLITVRSPVALVPQRLDEVFRNAAQAEASHHDGGAVADVADRLVGIANDFVQYRLLEPRSLNRGGLVVGVAGATTGWRRLAAPPPCRADHSISYVGPGEFRPARPFFFSTCSSNRMHS